MKAPKKQKNSGGNTRSGPFIQRMGRKPMAQKQENSFLSAQPNAIIQPKLTVNQPGDQYEQEADRMSDRIMRKPKSDGSPPMISRMNAGIQRKIKGKKGSLVPSELIVQRKNKSGTNQPYYNLEQQLNKTRGKGEPLPEGIQREMEQQFNSDFSSVRVHTDSEAVKMNQKLAAHAFTSGSDIYFNQGMYNPYGANGRRLLGHELTHVVQQGAGNRKKIQRASPNNQANNKIDISDILKVEEALNPLNGKAKIRKPKSGWLEIFVNDDGEKEIRITLANLKPKEYLWKSDLKNLTYPLHAPKPGSRKEEGTSQIKIWTDEVKKDVEQNLFGLIKTKYPKDYNFSFRDNNIFKLELTKEKGKNIALIGNTKQILDKIIVPFWDVNGKRRTYQVEHMVDYQLAGLDADRISNLILLESSYNMSLGSAVDKTFNDQLDQVTQHYSKYFSGFSSLAKENRERFTIKIDSFDSKHRPKKLHDWQWYFSNEIVDDTAPGNPYKNNLITISLADPAQINKDSFVLIASKAGAGIVIPKVNKTFYVGAFAITPQLSEDETEVTAISMTPIVKDAAGNLKKDKKANPIESNCTLVTENPIVKGNTYRLTDDNMPGKLGQKLKELIQEIKGLSPINFSIPPQFDDFHINAVGSVDSSLSIFKGLDIRFLYGDGAYRIEAHIPSNQLSNNFPSPFKIRHTELIIMAGSNIPLTVAGLVNIYIPNFGEGSLNVKGSKRGVTFDGQFIFEGDYFDKSSMQIRYANGKFSINAQLKVKENEIPGLKKAQATIKYDENEKVLSVIGSATIGFSKGKEVQLTLGIDKNGLILGGNVDLKKILPEVATKWFESSDFHLTLIGNKLSGKGNIKLKDLSWLKKPNVSFTYANGLMRIEGQGDIEIKRRGRIIAEGKSIKLGMTNAETDSKGNPTGKASDTWRFFGGGTLHLSLGKNISGNINVNLNEENGHPLISGKLVAAQNTKDEKDKENGLDDKSKKKEFEFPLLTLPIGSISVIFGWDFKKYINLYLPKLSQVVLEVNQPFDLLEMGGSANPDGLDANPQSIGIIIVFDAKADAGIELGAFIGLKAKLLHIIAAAGGITGSIGLEGNLKGSVRTGASWSPQNGLSFEGVEIDLAASAMFIAKLEGWFKLYLDLWLTEITLVYAEMTFAEKKFGDSFNLELNIKPYMDENTNMPRFDKVRPNMMQGFPDISSKHERGKRFKEAAASNDKRFKDPEPPSLEKAIREVSILPSGPIERSWHKKMNEGLSVVSIHVWHNKPAQRKKEIDQQIRKQHPFLSQVNDFMFGRPEYKILSRDTYLEWLSTQFPGLDWWPVFQVSLNLDKAEKARFDNKIRREWANIEQIEQQQSNRQVRERDRIIKNMITFILHHPVYFHIYPDELSNYFNGAKLPAGLFDAPRGTINAPILAPDQNAKVDFLEINMQHDVYKVDFEKGIKRGSIIKVRFETENLKDQNCVMAAYFFHNEKQLKNDEGKNVIVTNEFKPGYVNAIYNNFEIFLPISELPNFDDGKYIITFKLGVYPKRENILGNFIGYSESNSFIMRIG